MNNGRKNQENRFELREPLRSYLRAIRDYAGADACTLYLIEKNMDNEEKKECFEKRFGDGVKTQKRNITKEKIEEYSVLKFIGVADDKEDGEPFWRFDYKNRPDKYIVIHNAEPEFIEGEGITGMTARRRKVFRFNKEKIEDHPTRKGVIDKDDTAKKIHPPCVRVIAIPIKKEEEIFGVLRMDMYGKKEFDKEFIELLNSDNAEPPVFLNKITQLIVDQSTKDAEEKSYRSLYKGTKILEALKGLRKKEIGNTKNKEIKEILKMTTHLFFVFQRHTYIGYEEIMKRVLYFTEDLEEELNLNLPFGRLLQQFQNQENLMLYDINEYRDHFMHQFHVFILGYIIINQIGLDVISGKLNQRLQKIEGYEDFKIDEINVLRIWTLIAFFHDICYLFQKYKTGIENLIKDILKKDIPVSFDWPRILDSRNENDTEYPDYAKYLQKLCSFFTSIKDKKTTQHQLLTNYYQATLKEQDHGVFSALYLIEHLLFSNQRHRKYDEVEAYLAGLAISIHNSCVFNGLGEGDEFEILFESFPLEFILIYCDILAEWGRERSEKREKEMVSFRGPELEDFRYDKIRKEFTGILNYKEFHHLTRQTIDEKISKRKKVFKAKDFQFKIMCKLSGERPLIESFN